MRDVSSLACGAFFWDEVSNAACGEQGCLICQYVKQNCGRDSKLNTTQNCYPYYKKSINLHF